MKTFDRNSEQSKIDFLLKNIINYNDMNLSVVDSNWNPRSVCVNFDLDENFNIFWKSNKSSLHSKNLIGNKNASILIYRAYDEYDFAMYSTGRVRVVDESIELNNLLKIKYDNKWRMGKSSDQFLWESSNRIYLYEVEQLYIADKSHEKEEVDLKLLRSEWRIH